MHWLNQLTRGRTMKRITTSLVTAGALGAVLLTPAGTANAAVSKSDVLKLAQVADVYPSLDGGRRKVVRDREFFPPATTGCGSATMVAGRSGVLTAYSNPTRTEQIVKIHVIDFATKRKAQRSLTLFRGRIKDCPTFTEGDLTYSTAKLRAPRLGDDRVALRYMRVSPGDTFRSALILVREGRRLIAVAVLDTPKINRKKLARLGRLAYKRAS